MLNDEAKLKAKDRNDRAALGKNLKRAILGWLRIYEKICLRRGNLPCANRTDGDWTEVDQIVSKGPLVKTQNALLYALYKQREHSGAYDMKFWLIFTSMLQNSLSVRRRRH